MKIIWTAAASAELERVLSWFWERNPSAAMGLTGSLRQAMERLSAFPQSGRWVPTLETKIYRELLVKPLRIVYRAEGEDVLIVLVLRQEERFDPSRLQ